jgi:hypothetical protein
MFKRQKTVFTRNVKNVAVENIYTDNTNIVLNSKLKRIARTLITYIDLYIEGKMEELEQVFTLEVYTNYSRVLTSMRKNRLTDGEIVRRSIVNALSTLYSGLSVYKDYALLEQTNEQLRDRANILDDMERLKEYLEQLSSQAMALLGSHDITMSSANVNEEYILYIKEYGYPLNGVFDPEKLGIITRTLRNKNLGVQYSTLNNIST